MIKFADIPANESTEKSEVLSLQEESNLADKALLLDSVVNKSVI